MFTDSESMEQRGRKAKTKNKQTKNRTQIGKWKTLCHLYDDSSSLQVLYKTDDKFREIRDLKLKCMWKCVFA